MQCDEELVRATLAGRPAAFDALVDRYRDAACGIAYHYLGSFDDAQDAAQEAFVQAYLRLKQLREPRKFGPWLRRITANTCVERLRRRGPILLSLEAIGEDALGLRRPADSQRDADLDRLLVRQALDGLPEKLRLTVTLFYISGYSLAEIARFLDIPLNTVRSRLQNAKKRLREEMLDMANDVLPEGRPGPQFTRRVVEEALRRGDEALRAQEWDGAVQRYDEALMALDAMKPDAGWKSLRMDALWKKSGVTAAIDLRERILLKEQALSIAQEIGDDRNRAEKLAGLAGELNKPEQSVEYYRQALALYEKLDDKPRQAECLLWLGCQSLAAKQIPAGRGYFEQGVSLLEDLGSLDYAAVCRAALDLLAEVGAERFPSLIGWGALCDVLEQKDGALTRVCQPGFCITRDTIPQPFRFCSVFQEVSHLGTLIDSSIPVGGSWSGDSHSFSYRPLQCTVTVVSDSERVVTPAGSFERCLLTEEVTVESDLPDSAPDLRKKLNREYRCGTRRAWYAPGVGLAQLHVASAAGQEAVIQLRDFSTQGAGYLPLAEGNTWSYGWPQVEPGHVAGARYRVTAHSGDRWYLANDYYIWPWPLTSGA